MDQSSGHSLIVPTKVSRGFFLSQTAQSGAEAWNLKDGVKLLKIGQHMSSIVWSHEEPFSVILMSVSVRALNKPLRSEGATTAFSFDIYCGTFSVFYCLYNFKLRGGSFEALV